MNRWAGNGTWDGTVNHLGSHRGKESDWVEDGRSEDKSLDDDGIIELEGDELIESLQQATEHKEQLHLEHAAVYGEPMMRPLMKKGWKDIERN